jgi:Stigma-specific protein, Stig1
MSKYSRIMGLRSFGGGAWAVLLGVALSLTTVACGDDGDPCGPGTENCDGTCTVVELDPDNCGVCGNVCDAEEVCAAGECVLECVGGTEACGGACVNTDNDPDHCGGCDSPCGADEVCSSGSCGTTCVGGTTNCDGSCVNTDNDPAHCGGCDSPCAAGEVCSNGTCSLECVGGTTNCGGLCVNTDTDVDHCSGCSLPCDQGEVCSAGSCGTQCVGGTTLCDGNCVNTDNDPLHCGGCVSPCPTDEVCSVGQCWLECVGGTTECDDLCVDTQTDPAHCDGCSNPCGADEVCIGGTCTSVCGAGLTKCGNSCVDLTSDSLHCNACSSPCGSGEDCISSVCTPCDSNTTDCDGDGWMVADGDCCDLPGTCGLEPEMVNPGAVEVLGNGVDDNCNALVDLFDTADTVACDVGLASNSADPLDYARALGICRTTTESPPLNQRTWGLIDVQLLTAAGTALGDARAHSIRPGFGAVTPSVLEGQSIVVLSSGIAADGVQTNPGPNGGAPSGGNVSTSHTPTSSEDITTCTSALCISDWFTSANPPLKNANELPVAPACGSGTDGEPHLARDSVMLYLRLRVPTNARAFSFNTYFFSAEYPEYVCSNYNDQFIALIDTPSGTPQPIPNPVDKNLMTYNDSTSLWPIGINIASGTSLFSICETETTNPGCWDTDVAASSCALGAAQLANTGFDANTTCTIGGGTYWLTTSGNAIPGEILELRIVIWDVGDTAFDSLALIDGFRWLSNATVPGTG